MNFELISRSGLDRDRGIALLVAGAVMVLLKWILPVAAPFAVLAFAIYQLANRRWQEGLIFLAVAVVLWLLRMPLGWLLWLLGFLMVGFGVFYLIRSIRDQPLPH